MEKRELIMKVEEAFDATLITKDCTNEELCNRLDRYDNLVDELVELTEGKDSAYATDPMGALDFKALTGRSSHGMSYNEMAEELGAFAFGE
jgi:hypothetical protein